MAVPVMAALAVVSAVGAVKQGYAQAAGYKYQATIADQNAQVATQNATWSAQSGEEQAGQEEQKTRQESAAIRTTQAGNGIDVNSGSAVDVQASKTELGMQDAMQIRANAARTAYGYQNQEQSFKADAEADRSSASNATTSAWLKGGTSLLSGAAGAAEYGGFGGDLAPDGNSFEPFKDSNNISWNAWGQ